MKKILLITSILVATTGFASAESMTTLIDRLATKGDVIQIYSKMTVGATRLEDKKVVEVITSEA